MRKIKLLTTLPLVAAGLVMASCGPKGPAKVYADAEACANAIAAALGGLTQAGTPTTVTYDEDYQQYVTGIAFAAASVDFAAMKGALDNYVLTEELSLVAGEDWTVVGSYTSEDDTTTEGKTWTVDDLLVEAYVYSHTIQGTAATCVDIWVGEAPTE